MDLGLYPEVKRAKKFDLKDAVRVVIALLFILGVMLYVSMYAKGIEHQTLLVVAAIFGGYMAMNIGANDVANNVGPAVGSGALSMMGAIVIAAIFEAAGALIAGADVVGTIRKGIIDPNLIANTQVFVWLMMAALLAGAIWLNLATAIGAPVSTTHSIVGGVMGAGIAAAGFAAVSWPTMGKIAASWVISPLLGGAIAALFLYVIKKNVIFQENKIEAAKKWVPLYIAIMSWAFGSYLIIKGLKHIVKVPLPTAIVIGFFIALGIYFFVKPLIVKKADRLENDRESINILFTIPLIFSAALLSFAHGANDVANAVGPLAGISDAIMSGDFGKKAPIPLWVMMVGALGIAIGLALYGPKLIRKVGSEITELDQIRAFCIALAAAITVIVASALGLPVSSTHIAVGGVFGVGFLREYLMRLEDKVKQEEERLKEEFQKAHIEEELEKLSEYKRALEALGDPKKADPFIVKALIEKINREKEVIAKLEHGQIKLTKIEKKALKALKKYELVQRSALKMIVAAWLITVPAAAVLAAMIYFMIRGIMLP
ncbi:MULTISPECIES: inorganic phosphate transporter [unclassified Nitratiruptor]|uniref:inorganic phosphate transporter n=1 Tax=unclassified Nitratiruptor TaxID=2624044 RepID=UPI0019169E97|nr:MULTISPECIES: inorganic phosphate transporter [unclassified Nitratiruptor]BCD59867.1 inorganic phosphate transporter, PiT family [Nitratiruptor sp. YY08-10]BCD63790.1 inorganic phosphate transporter, PiT family [Nitratiruptor sp. YY08-14]